MISAQKEDIFLKAQLLELLKMDSVADAETLLNKIKCLGRLPRRVGGDADEQRSEHNLAERLASGKRRGICANAQHTQLTALDSAAAQQARRFLCDDKLNQLCDCLSVKLFVDSRS